MKKVDALSKVAREIEECKECRKDSIGKAVAGEGNPDAKVMFVGEAPGKTEAATGRPFVGRSGKYLRSLINRIGLKDEDVYITSPVKYLPKKGTPTLSQIEHGRKHFLSQVEIINPQILVLLGNVAVQAVLSRKIPVMKEHGTTYFLTIHPAAAIRFFKFRKVIEEDFQKLKKLIH